MGCDGATLDAEVRFRHEECDLGLALYERDGDLLGSSETQTDDESLLATGLAADMVLLRVYGESGGGGPYALRLGVACPRPGDDPLEENDSPLQAVLLRPDTYPGLLARYDIPLSGTYCGIRFGSPAETEEDVAKTLGWAQRARELGATTVVSPSAQIRRW